MSVIRQVSYSVGWKAPEYAEPMATAISEGEELVDSWDRSSNGRKLYGGRFRRVREGEEPVISQRVAFGNAATDTVYILLFESPESSWDEMWKLGETMLGKFVLEGVA